MLTWCFTNAELQSYARSANYDEFNRLKSLVQNPDHDFTGYPPSRSSARPLSNNPMQPQNQYQNSFAASPSKPAHIMSPKSNTPGPSKSILKSGLNTFCADWHLGAPLFKPSPFYSIVEPLTPVLECKGELKSPYQGSCVDLFQADNISPKS